MEATLDDITLSARGDNAFHLAGCQHVQHSPAYAACLNRLRLFDENRGNLPAIHRACEQPINNGMCQARRMRKEELVEGKPLYYVPRARIQEAAVNASADAAQRSYAKYSSFGRVSQEEERKKPSAPAPKPKPRDALDILAAASDGYAAAINNAVASEVNNAVVAPPAPALSLPPPSGDDDSMLARARRALAAKQ